MKRYVKYIRPYWKSFVFGPILMITEVLGEVLLPFFMAKIINVGAATHNVPYIISIGGVMLLTAFIMMAGGIGGSYFAAKASISFAADLRSDLFRKVQEFSFHNIDTFSTGSLVTRLTNDVTQVQNVILLGLKLLLRAPGMLIGAVIMAFVMNPALATILLVVIPLLALAIGAVIKVAFPRFSVMQKKIDALNSRIQEALTNVRIIKSFVREDFEKKKFAASNADLKQSGLRAFHVVILNMPIMMLAMNVTTLAVVWTGGKQVLAGTMPVGDLTAFTTYIVQVLMSLMMLAMVLLQSSRAVASLKRITEVLDTRIDLTDEDSQKKDAVITKGTVEFRGVSFSYYKGSREKVLSDISFRIEAGETVGIIGSTGCGKTTLVQMIPRLYDADAGAVYVDGVDVRDYSLRHLRDSVGMVLQKNVLFSGTIADNLRWGDENADMETIEAAASAAQAADFIDSFPEKYETNLSQGGVNVSGGQKQRLCIARALLKKPKILILDDSTSAVDTATEAEIRKSFAGELKETTKIIIAQRITSVMDADKIIVMEEGRIAGMGTHEEMLAQCETYREIYESQMDKEVSA
ncbi:MAG: ABC transporter ATP-binding protein [Lachnospiraceae bacterium]|nr:ABC transporter ATP-binding protein [Lachnospiraceae bacterium]